MRILFLLLLLVGGVAMAAFPWFSDNFLARPAGTWRLYDSVTGALPAQVRLVGGSLDVLVDMTTTGPSKLSGEGAVLTLTAATGGRTVLAEALTFAGSEPSVSNPQTGEKVFRARAGVIATPEPGDYTFTLGLGDAEGITVRRVDLVLMRQGVAYDSRIQPLGFVLIAIGFIGSVLSIGRGKGGPPPQNPNSQPPPPRWGRSAGNPG